MSQRQTNFIQPSFGEQSLAALQAQLCEQLPLGCFGTKVTDSIVWQLLCYASTRRTSLEQTTQMLVNVPSANRLHKPSWDCKSAPHGHCRRMPVT